MPEPRQELIGFSRGSSGDKDGVIAGNRAEDRLDTGPIDLKGQKWSAARPSVQDREIAADVGAEKEVFEGPLKIGGSMGSVIAIGAVRQGVAVRTLDDTEFVQVSRKGRLSNRKIPLAQQISETLLIRNGALLDEIEDQALPARLGGHWMIMHGVHKDVKFNRR
jgi:hypothetical protein